MAIEAGAPTPYNESPGRFGFVETSSDYSPSRTVVVPLLEDEPLLAQMGSSTRTNVRGAGRNGVEIRQEPANQAAVLGFHSLLQQTATRQEVRINPPEHYLEALRLFGDDAARRVATVNGATVAGLITARFGNEAI